MKTLYLSLAILLAALAPAAQADAQALLPNQNPNYAVSRDKYMGLADSLTRLHGTTQHDTYAAPDWYEQKLQRRDDRREFRQQLRLERARYHRGYSDYYGYQPYRYDGHRHQRYYRPWWLWPF
ncbi:MAG TPA: hypothetical protein VGE66_10440 [Chitinophagaceae bacterium]